MRTKVRGMLPNQGILKDYQGEGYRLTGHRWLPIEGLELEREYVEKGSVNDEKLDCNLARARSKVYELAKCNPWSWFVTLTLDQEKYDRKDLERYRHDFSQFMRDSRKCDGGKYAYMTIPELHKDKAWHMHGLLEGVPMTALRPFTQKERMPIYIHNKLKAGQQVYDWTAYRERFGYSIVEPIRNKEACCKYVTKYLNKQMQKDVLGVGKHLYYRSRGLLEAIEKERGTIYGEMAPDYENEHVRVQWIDAKANLEEVRQHFFGTSI